MAKDEIIAPEAVVVAPEVAADAVAPEAADTTGLVKVWMHGATLLVHPSCVDAHVAAGWVVTPEGGE